MQEEHGGLDHRLKMDFIADQHGSLRQKVRRILNRGLVTWKKDKSRGAKEAFSYGEYNAFVFDVGRRAGKYSYIYLKWCDAEGLDQYLRKPRSVEKAKKRFQLVLTTNTNK